MISPVTKTRPSRVLDVPVRHLCNSVFDLRLQAFGNGKGFSLNCVCVEKCICTAVTKALRCYF